MGTGRSLQAQLCSGQLPLRRGVKVQLIYTLCRPCLPLCVTGTFAIMILWLFLSLISDKVIHSPKNPAASSQEDGWSGSFLMGMCCFPFWIDTGRIGAAAPLQLLYPKCSSRMETARQEVGHDSEHSAFLSACIGRWYLGSEQTCKRNHGSRRMKLCRIFTQRQTCYNYM